MNERGGRKEQVTLPKSESDYRVMLWFFSWLFAMFLCSGMFVLVVIASPRAQAYVGDHPWLIPVLVVAAFVCVSIAAFPFFFGIRCRRCKRKLRRMKAGTDLATGNSPLRFHCTTCNVIWETHLVSGPGSSDANL
jgi:hypothetical protein